ncbi:MAG: D-mannonate oxidoreductase, partial [Bacteroidetes bacterium]|nr:D-mannonate oxidoreductase [Bacteroidota bacterium]
MNLEEITKLYDFSGKTVLLTGGAGVLTGEIACALFGCNANIAIIDRDPALADTVMKRLEPVGDRAIVVYGDVLQPEVMQRALAQVIRAFGKVDYLVNGAGGNNPRATTTPSTTFFDLPQEAIRFVSDLNLLGTIIPSQVIGRHMAERKEGVILNISSMNAFRPLTRIPAYSASKAAVTNFTQWLAVYMAQEVSPCIRVNAIAPGVFLTNQNRYLLIDKETGGRTPRGSKILEHTPMGRYGTPEDLLGTVLWLL